MSAPISSSAPVLVAILNDVRDFALARDEHWYRIPCDKAEKWLGDRWPPRWLAFYQTKVFGPQSHSVTWYAEVRDIRKVRRCELFPDQPRTWKSQHYYYQLLLGPLQRRREPILSRRYRHIVFIATTGKKFNNATEINDLFDDSPLEDRLWAELKRLRLSAERQEFIGLDTEQAALDFAIYCAAGKIAVETDGDTWHANPVKAAEDNVRDNALEVHGWSLLRFTTAQIVERLNEYCIPKIVEKINALGGADEGGQIARRIELPDGMGRVQKGLFDSA